MINLANLQLSCRGYILKNQNKGNLVNKYVPFKNLIVGEGGLSDFTTNKITFELDHPVEIDIQDSFDGSVNLIFNDDLNRPRLINSRFSIAENSTFIVPDHYGNKDSNLYTDQDLDIDTSLYKSISLIMNIEFRGLTSDGEMKCGAYHFYFKLADNDDNETDFIGESGLVQIHIGDIKQPHTIRMGMENENTKKAVHFHLRNIDAAYDFVKIYYTRSTSGSGGYDIKTVHEIDQKFPLNNDGTADIVIFGTEGVFDRTLAEINPRFEYCGLVKSQAVCQNRLFFGNVYKPYIPYDLLKNFSLRLLPSIVNDRDIGNLDDNYDDQSFSNESHGYYNTLNVYYSLGYWPEEFYRFGVVYILNDFTLSPVFNIRGARFLGESKIRDFKSHATSDVLYDDDGYILDTNLEENAFGVVKMPNLDLLSQGVNPIGIKVSYADIDLNEESFKAVQKYVKGYFLVRQERLPTILALGISIGKTKNKYGDLPCLKFNDNYVTESFLTKFISEEGVSTNILKRSMIDIPASNVELKALLVPEANIREATFNNIFTSAEFKLSAYSNTDKLTEGTETLRYIPNGYSKAQGPQKLLSTKLTMVNSGMPLTTDGSTYFSGRAGEVAEIDLFKSVVFDWSGEGNNASTVIPPNNFITAKPLLSSTLSSDRVVRGLFGTYVGSSEKLSGFGKIYNIKVGDFEETPEHYKNCEQIRYNSNSKYFAISDRHNLDLLTSNNALSYFRGDCFINSYTHRMVRNFIDPETPTNTRIIDPTAWHDNFRVLTKTKTIVDGKPFYVNQVLPLFKVKEIVPKADKDKSDSENVIAGLVLDGADVRSSNFKEELELVLNSEVDTINWLSENIRMILPEDSKYGKAGNTGEFFGLANPWKECGLSKVSRSDVNSIGLGHWVTFKVLSNHNLAMRDVDFWETAEEAAFGKKRSFYPLQKLSLDASGLAESTKINGAANLTLSSRYNIEMPDVPYIKQLYDTRILYSDIAANNAFKNGFRVFGGSNYRDYPMTYGALVKILEFMGNIVSVMEHGVLLIPVNERTLSGSGDGGLTHINTANILPDSPMVLSSNYGTIWKDSVVTTEGFIYGVDTVAKKIWRTSGKEFDVISDFKLQKFLNDNIKLNEWDKFMKLGVKNVKTFYNAGKRDVMFVFYNGATKWNLCWNELTLTFTTFYSWTPAYGENIDNIFISFDQAITNNILASTNLNTKKLEEFYLSEFLSKGLYIIPTEITDIDGTSTSPIVIQTFRVYEQSPPISLNTLSEEYSKFNKYFKINEKREDVEGGSVVAYELIYNPEHAEIILKKDFLEVYLGVGGTIVNLQVINSSKCTHNIWKHGLAGNFEGQERILPTKWYDRQETFEFEVIMAENAFIQKIYTNLMLISNKAAPSEFEFEVVGESYDWFKYKKIITWLNDISPSSEDLEDNYLLLLNLTLTQLKAMGTLMGIPYPGLDGQKDDYIIRKLPFIKLKRRNTLGIFEDNDFEQNSTDVWLVEDAQVEERKIHTNQLGNDIKTNGRLRGNMEYLEDSWRVEIRPINFRYAYIKDGKLAFSKLETSRIRDKYCKIKVKYSGEELAVLQGLKTIFSYSHS